VGRLDLDGRTLGEFTLREKIGEGGFAAVHRAEQIALGREAVVKVLHTRLATSPEVAQRFLREARLASRIDHPYAAHVYAFGAEADGLLWIAMELVRGTPMDKLLEQGPLTLEQLVPLFERICEVVQNAHDHGIVHRDLKPGNVMVMTRGSRLLPKLLDFGIARALDDVEPDEAIATAPPDHPIDPRATTAWVEVDRGGTRRGQVMGSPSYMAPEQWIDAGSVGPATDIYALGVLAFQALSGRVPYAGTVAAVRTSHLEAAPPALGSQFPPAVDALLSRALAKKPLERYGSATELAAAMRAAAGFEDGALPLLPPAIREAALGAVQPIAEAVAAQGGARNLDQGAALIGGVTTAAIRWLAIVALAARTSIGAGEDVDSEPVRERLRQLGRGRLDDAGWFALACELTRPFKDKRGAYPVPELIDLLHGELPTAIAHLHELVDQLDRRVQRDPATRRALYGDAITALARVLDALAPLAAYTVIVPVAGRAERWRGVRRVPRTTARVTGSLTDGCALLLDREDVAVLQLAPLVQIAPPAPGREVEMFWFDGKGSRAARLVAMPAGFERSDPALDDMLRAELGDLDEPAATLEPESPYRGLAPFTEEFAADYVGREREVEAFVNRLIAEPLLAVVGPSGAGKSSFVQAGVLPELPASWRAITVRPGAAPLAALEAHLHAAGVDARGLRDDPGTLAEALREAATREHATLVLVIDQLEELFTLCKDDRERAAFAAAIADATRTELDPFRVVVTLRDDFLIRAAGMPGLGDRLAHGLQLLTTPAPDDLERIVTLPARRAGYGFDDPALATEMVDAVAMQPGALALLSFTAAELWKLRDRHFRQLTRKAYLAIGGVAGALAKHAEATLTELSVEDQRLVRIAFRHLVTVDGTRQVLTVDELHQLLDRNPRARAVVDRLIAARLLVASEDTGGVARIEIIHEALLAAWPRLVEWRREDAEGARLRDQLRIAARQWDARGRPRGLLWRDDALAEYRIWRARHPGRMTELEETFGRTSLDDERRGRRLRRTLLVTAFLVLGGGAAVLFQLRSQAAAQREEAEAATQHADEQRAVAEARANELVLVNAQASLERDPTTTIGRLKQYPITAPHWDSVHELAIRAQQRGVARHVLPASSPRWLGFTHDDRWLVSAGARSIQTWDAATGRLLGTIEHTARIALEPVVSSFAIWPDDSAIAFVDEHGVVSIAALPGPSRPRAVMTDKHGVPTISPDGRYLVSIGEQAQLFDRDTGTVRILDPRPNIVTTVAFTRDGRMFTGGTDRTVRSWDLRSLESRPVLSQPVNDLEVSPDGTSFVLTSSEGALLVAGDHPPRVLTRERLGATRPAFSPDGRWVVVTELGSVGMWDATTGARIAGQRDAPGITGFALGISADRRVVVSNTAEGVLELELPLGARRILLGDRTVFGVAVSSTGARTGVIGGDGQIRIWERRGPLPWVIREHPSETIGIEFSPDGAMVATSSGDGMVRVTNLTTHQAQVVPAGAEQVYAVEFSSDGRRLATSTMGARVAVWDAVSRRTITLEHGSSVEAVRFTPDGNTLITTSEDGLIRIWDLATATARTLPQPGAAALDVSPDGTSLVVGAAGRVVLWDLAHGTARTLGHHVNFDEIGDVRFLDGGHVVSRGARQARVDHALHVWDLATGTGRIALPSQTPLVFAVSGGQIAAGGRDGVIRLVRGHEVRELRGHSRGVRALAWSPDGRSVASGADDGSVRLWNAETGASQILHQHDDAVRGVAFSRDGRFVGSTSNDHTVWIGEPHPERCLERAPAALSKRLAELSSIELVDGP